MLSRTHIQYTLQYYKRPNMHHSFLLKKILILTPTQVTIKILLIFFGKLPNFVTCCHLLQILFYIFKTKVLTLFVAPVANDWDGCLKFGVYFI